MTELLQLLQEFRREKFDMLLRHQAAACHIHQYDANNAYQYVVNREDVQHTWLTSAVTELGGLVEADEPAGRLAAREPEDERTIAADDARDAQAFVDRWRPRVERMTNARHRGMLRVILGETLEHKRFFEQAAGGQTDLLGRRPDHVGPRTGRVLSTRWIE